ncbi:mediator of RNA polymerase II transcription subunit 12-like isoform X1 [Acipenser ruthenus]|uniref:mediator of RNA polymerase II transcription subunit 12-like isoform X1 n=2 Tax=Acipenser ruthenus TaxID=7906 RepID=UPI00274153B0|nr:mediator of RNA polymerase II transcription subunit 12-like isoform X1 [Acipenser ruthenus]
MSLPWMSDNEDTCNRENLQCRMAGEAVLCAFAGYIGFTLFFNIIKMVYALLMKRREQVCSSAHAEWSEQSELPSDWTSGGVTSSEDVRGPALPGWMEVLRDGGANVTLLEADGLECDGLGNGHRFRYIIEPLRLTVEGYGGPPSPGAGNQSVRQEQSKQQLRKHAHYIEREASSVYNTDEEKVAQRREPEESWSREPRSEASGRRLPQTQGPGARLCQSPAKEGECSSSTAGLRIPRQEPETRIRSNNQVQSYRSPSEHKEDSLSNGYRSVKTERPSGYRTPKQRASDRTESRCYQASPGRCLDMQEAGRLRMGSPVDAPANYSQPSEYSQRHFPPGHNQEQLGSPGTRKRQLFRYSEEDPAEKHLNSTLGQPTLCTPALPPLFQVRAVYKGQQQVPQYNQQQQTPKHQSPQQQPLHQSHQQSQHRESSFPARTSRRM